VQRFDDGVIFHEFKSKGVVVVKSSRVRMILLGVDFCFCVVLTYFRQA
jgi:hypothetical protein